MIVNVQCKLLGINEYSISKWVSWAQKQGTSYISLIVKSPFNLPLLNVYNWLTTMKTENLYDEKSKNNLAKLFLLIWQYWQYLHRIFFFLLHSIWCSESFFKNNDKLLLMYIDTIYIHIFTNTIIYNTLIISKH